MTENNYYRIRVIFLSFMICLFASPLILSAGESHLSAIYIQKAWEAQLSRNTELAVQYLNKAEEYKPDQPEYDYLRIQTLPDDRRSNFYKRQYADHLVDSLSRRFFLSRKELLLEAIHVYESVRHISKAFNLYRELFKLQDESNESQMLDCMRMLALEDSYRDLGILIRETEGVFESLDRDYYKLLTRIVLKDLNRKESEEGIRSLQSQGYPPDKLLYLRSWNRGTGKELLEEYRKLKKDRQFTDNYQKKILYPMIRDSDSLRKEELTELLKDWLEINGNFDLYTEDLTGKTGIKELIRSDKKLNEAFLNFTGKRMLDANQDGFWEAMRTYQNGTLIEEVLDYDQDDKPEFSAKFHLNGNIKAVTLYETPDNYEIYYGNQESSRLQSAEFFRDRMLVFTRYYQHSRYLINLEESEMLRSRTVNQFIDRDQYGEPDWRMIKYSQGSPVYGLIDRNRNQQPEEKLFYENGVISRVIKDLDEDGFFDITEYYRNGKIQKTEYRDQKNSDRVFYKEQVLTDKIEKTWDENHDGIDELKIIEQKEGLILKYLDIDFDGAYDFLDETKVNNVKNIYRIQKNGTLSLINRYDLKEKDDSKNWIVVSGQLLDHLKIPESIQVQDKTDLNGIYYYQNKKIFFKKGILNTKDFSYRLLIYENKLYLIDQMR
jgi:hypothetical protein